MEDEMLTGKNIVCITVGCKVMEDIENHFSMMGNNWQRKIIETLRKKFGESVKLVRTKKLPGEKKAYTFAINGDCKIKIITKETDKTKALLEAMIRYVSIHSGIKRVLCQNCEHGGTDKCLEYYLPVNSKMTEESVCI
jgi:hypothetical protein